MTQFNEADSRTILEIIELYFLQKELIDDIKAINARMEMELAGAEINAAALERDLRIARLNEENMKLEVQKSKEQHAAALKSEKRRRYLWMMVSAGLAAGLVYAVAQ